MDRVLTASELERKFEIQNAQEIVKLTEEFRLRPKEFRAAIPQLKERLKIALKKIGQEPRKITVISVKETEQCIARFPSWYGGNHIPEFWLNFGPGSGNIRKILNNIIRELPFSLKSTLALRHEKTWDFQKEIYELGLGIPVSRLVPDSYAIQDQFTKDYAICVCLQSFCLASGLTAEVLKFECFTDLFRNGNWPVGIGEDGNFLVLAA